MELLRKKRETKRTTDDIKIVKKLQTRWKKKKFHLQTYQSENMPLVFAPIHWKSVHASNEFLYQVDIPLED